MAAAAPERRRRRAWGDDGVPAQPNVGLCAVSGGRMRPLEGSPAVRGATAADDAVLAAAIGRRQPTAMAALYDRFGRAVYSLARRVLGDEHLAEDVVQEVFVVVWSEIGRFDPARGRLGSWLLTITHRTAVDAVAESRPGAGTATATRAWPDKGKPILSSGVMRPWT